MMREMMHECILKSGVYVNKVATSIYNVEFDLQIIVIYMLI